MDVGNIPAPRPWDALEARCAQSALQAVQAELEFMPVSQRLIEPERYVALQETRRALLERFLWVEPNPAALERMQDLIAAICEEGAWSASGAAFDDPARPAIDLQAAETGALFAWLLRRHGARLTEMNPRIPSLMRSEARRRLLAPLLAHDDYPFMRGGGRCPALLLCDLLLCCLMLEKNPARRHPPVKLLLKLLDQCCAAPQSGRAPYAQRLADACAVADLARLLKRLTRGELDLTREAPPQGWADGALIPWISGGFFFDPAGRGMRPEVAGMDLYRLGHLLRDRALCALGAQLDRLESRPGFSVTGRVLNMEYMRAAQDEFSAPPRLRRAVSEDGSAMLSRVENLCAAIAGAGGRGNAGDVALFCGAEPVLFDLGAEPRSLPLIDGCAQLSRPARLPDTDANFGAERDLMSIDLTDSYPESCALSAYQRTLMTSRADATVRLVDAFEFRRVPSELTYRFVCAQPPASLEGALRLGPLTLRWDGDMRPEISELPGDAGGWLIRFTLRNVPPRLICGFSFAED